MQVYGKAAATPAHSVTGEVKTSVCCNVFSSPLQELWSLLTRMIQGFSQQAGLSSVTVICPPVATCPPLLALNDESEYMFQPLLAQPMSVAMNKKCGENLPLLSQPKRVRVLSPPSSGKCSSDCDFSQGGAEARPANRDAVFYTNFLTHPGTPNQYNHSSLH